MDQEIFFSPAAPWVQTKDTHNFDRRGRKKKFVRRIFFQSELAARKKKKKKKTLR
eukprot:NODE_9131_length_330_cov_36.370107_g7367_i0.p2 GENE.NODE_9131_length_330_cov_36.370107_g7367_i0~~NODE_9131_length_330_cov_36.370107_g7367_i0.p2  ORF type:complete len:55 (-),score=24.85 NODE_9131_length_330_cov_36.370107_g7367_i0:4-168(-)